MSSLLLFRVACRIFYFIWEDLWFCTQKTSQSELSLLPFPFPSFCFLFLFIVDSLFSLFLQSLIASVCFMCLSCVSILPLFVPVSLFFNSSVLSSLWSVCVLVWHSCLYLYLVVFFFSFEFFVVFIVVSPVLSAHTDFPFPVSRFLFYADEQKTGRV